MKYLIFAAIFLFLISCGSPPPKYPKLECVVIDSTTGAYCSTGDHPATDYLLIPFNGSAEEVRLVGGGKNMTIEYSYSQSTGSVAIGLFREIEQNQWSVYINGEYYAKFEFSYVSYQYT